MAAAPRPEHCKNGKLANRYYQRELSALQELVKLRYWVIAMSPGILSARRRR